MATEIDDRLDTLVTLFEERRMRMEAYTRDIVNELKHVITGIATFLDVRLEDMSIVDINMIERQYVHIALIVTTDENHISSILEELSPSPPGTFVTQRAVQLKIPFTEILKTPADLVQFLTEQLQLFKQVREEQREDLDVQPEEKSTKVVVNKNKNQQFDTTGLTAEQKKQLQWAEQLSTEVKH